MTNDSKAAILMNDLDSMVHRIEELDAHPDYTAALIKVQEARDAIGEARIKTHHAEMAERFKQQDAA